MAFPDGSDSVKRAMAADLSKTVQFGWTPLVRSVAINALVNAYNRDLLEVEAYSEALNQVKAGFGTYTIQLREWVVAAAERMTGLMSRAEYTLGLAIQAAEGFCRLASCNGLFDEEKKAMVRLVLGQYSTTLGNSVSVKAAEVSRVRVWREQLEQERRPTTGFQESSGLGSGYIEMSPAAKQYTGYPVSRFRNWAAGGGIGWKPGPVSSSASSSSSYGGHVGPGIRKIGDGKYFVKHN